MIIFSPKRDGRWDGERVKGRRGEDLLGVNNKVTGMMYFFAASLT